MGKLRIELLGTTFTIQANENSEYLEKLLGYYKQITDNVKQIDSVKSPLQIAILSGIMLCDELYKEKENKITSKNGQNQININSEEQKELERRTREMIEKIEKVL